MADVFVSYARSDKARVAPLVAAIEAKGWSVWWDPAIDPGQEFDRQISAELEAAAAVLVVWTPTSVASRWVRGEARDGAERGVLVPVRFEHASLPIDVRALHTTDLDDWREDPCSALAQEVLRALGVLINRDCSPTPAGRASDSVPSAPAVEPARVAICVLPFANKRAKDIDPYFDQPWYWRGIGLAYMVLHRYAEALAPFNYLPARHYRVAALVAGCYARLADVDRARVSAAECLALKPDFSTGRFVAKQPFKNPADAATLTESLLMAGLPE